MASSAAGPTGPTYPSASEQHTVLNTKNHAQSSPSSPTSQLQTARPDLEANPNGPQLANTDPLDTPRLSLAHRSLRTTWAWFTMTMSTGALASLLAQQPYTFSGLTTIGAIFYVVDVVCFCFFSLLMLGRFARKPRAFTTSLHHPGESFFFGAFWVSLALIINGIQVYGVPHCGEWLVSAARVLFWMYFASATLVAVLQYQIIFHSEKMTISDAVPAWILPAYPFLVVGLVASALAKTQPPESALQLIIGGIAGQGLGWILAFFIYTVYLARLIRSSLPPPSARPGMYVSVGPAAYTCAGMLSLGQQAKTQIPPHFLGVESFPVGEVWFAISVPVALFLWLIAAWFAALSTVSILRGIPDMHFSIQWWAFIFPNAGLAIATIQIGEVLDSRGVKVVGSIITVMLIPLWIMCAVLHVWKVCTYELLAPGRDMGVGDVNEMHEVKKEKRLERKRRGGGHGGQVSGRKEEKQG